MESVLLKASDGASAALYTHGAHLCSWTPAGGAEQLFLSKTSELREGVAIRGGVPVIFPQFAALGNLPKHGFARTAVWRVLRAGQNADGVAQAVFELQESSASLQLWPQIFKAELTVSVFADSLQIALTVVNTGDTAFSFTCALHTYFAVQQIADVQLHGLQGLRYRDSVSGISDCLDNAAWLRVEGEVDRIYANIPAAIELRQPQQTTVITQTGFSDAVIWNPGAEKGSSLSDLEPDGYQRMLCVEAAAIMQPVHLAAGTAWSGSQSMRVLAAKRA
ncbi:D-hexose-6-phosphate mutarotase [Undibacterium sp. Ren11W]|uniref:D-hexose-6-phosphate mutarotase n=1 Tax=Undibacterium sp. Ren11W TaxID=3413045 RepID=UPI003BF06608